MTDNNSDYQFWPRPDAKAMNWEDLPPPLKNGVRELLVLIAGANKISKKKQNVEQEPDIDSKETVNCFLLHGARGAGKTTVLLSAKQAINKQKDFFPKWLWNEEKEPTMPEFEKNNAHKAYKCVTEDELKHVVWLDLLDMEPLPADANLLATVLTRVRNALETCEGVNRDSALTSIFEEDTNSARHLLSGLINDATMMWEDIKETDTRESASRQITTAGIYASFRKRFIKAIDKLSKELGRPYGHDVQLPIILPLDNIDRSTEHLKSIVKLAELVSHPHLWLVMAGGREEISTYLERAYWKELISTHLGVGFLGRTDPKGEDETLAMARRQAAAAAQKLWPSNHRIKLKRVEPEVALAFKPKDEKMSLEDLFEKIDIPNWLDKPATQTSEDQKQKTKDIKLIDLFKFRDISPQLFSIANIKDVESLLSKLKDKDRSISRIIWQKFTPKAQEKLRDTSKQPSDQFPSDKLCPLIKELNNIVKLGNNFYVEIKEHIKEISLRDETQRLINDDSRNKNFYRLNRLLIEDAFPTEIEKSSIALTRAAQLALRLPVRSLLDLWQITYWVYKDPITFPADYRRAEKITRTMLRNTLSESGVPYKISKTLHEYVIRYEPDKGTLLNFKELEFKVDCCAPYDTARRLYSTSKPQTPGDSPIKSFIDVRYSKDGFQIFKLKDAQSSHRDEEYYEELPINVAGWLVILYDILSLSDKLAIINRAKIDPPVIGTTHEIVIEQEGNRKRHVEQHLKWPMPKWKTLRAYDIFSQGWKEFQKDYEWKSENLAKQQKKTPAKNPMELQSRYLAAGWVLCVLNTFWSLTCKDDKPIDDCEPLSQDYIDKFETKVMQEASQLYSKINAEVSKSYDYFNQDIMCHWLENELPLLMSYWYVPTSDRLPGDESHFATILKHLKSNSQWKKLAESWKENLPFIVAKMDDNLESLFQEEAADKPDKEYQGTLGKINMEYRAYLKELQKFCALHNWPTN